ncbi:hypothetical protein CH267_15840 [Rhodococcus sp. 06-621-2]|nr:MFS transporter [Rhodococcus sp. 06-621-2]OZC53675.1 hypothetical protein CH267_15840 [Rhodococcus sp. 06-621-2]
MRSAVPKALQRRNFALFFAGQTASNTGVWFQNLALSLWVLDSTGSASALALVTVCQFGPILLFSTYAGGVADRISPRKILLCTAFGSSLCAASLAVAVVRPDDHLAVLLAIVAVSGSVQAFERAAAQGFLYELVGPDLLSSAVSLNTVALAAARSVGPGLAGLCYATFGAAYCFSINAAGYVTVVIVLCSLNSRQFVQRRTGAARHKLRTDVKILAAVPGLRALFGVNAAVTVLALNFMVVVTAMVTVTLGGSATELGAAHALNAVGAVVGGLAVSSRARIATATVAIGALMLGSALALAAISPNLVAYLIVSPMLGLGLGAYQSSINARVQSLSPPALLGRTGSLLTLGSYGVAPVGALIAGVVIDGSNARVAMVMGAATCLACALVLFRLFRKN